MRTMGPIAKAAARLAISTLVVGAVCLVLAAVGAHRHGTASSGVPARAVEPGMQPGGNAVVGADGAPSGVAAATPPSLPGAAPAGLIGGGMHAPAGPSSTRPGDPVAMADRYADAEVLSSIEQADDTGGCRRIARLLRTTFKYPFIRVEDERVWSASSRTWVLVRQTAMVADHVLVTLREGRTRDELAALAAGHGAAIRRDLRTADTYLVAAAPALETVPELVRALRRATGIVAIAEPDMLVHAAAVPNDLLYNNQWYLPHIGLPSVWNFATGRGTVVVAVIDTGADYVHPELAPNIWINGGEIAGNGKDDDGNGYIDDVNGWDFDEDDNSPTDAQSHGTHVAGTIGAVGNNGDGVAGVCWNVRVMPIRFIGEDGEGATSDAIDSLNYAILMRRRGANVRVVNASWGGGGFSDTLRLAIGISATEGMLFVAAAGNDGMNNDITAHYPSNYENASIIAVANTDRFDARRSTSNYGAVKVDLGAPGTDIYNLYPGVYGYKTGTSMSAPVVSGVAALLWEYLPELTWGEVKAAILDGCDPVASMAGVTVTGGRLNAYGAFKAIPPRIVHVPPGNTTNTVDGHIIEARVIPADLLASPGVTVRWNTNGLGHSFTTGILTRVTNDLFRGTIPAVPLDTTVYYSLHATTVGGGSTASPTNAPAAVHAFSVVMAQDLAITGTPEAIGTVTPPYGGHTLPYAEAVTAMAPAVVGETNGQRFACVGWFGGGSVPAAGATNRVSFVIRGPSSLAWRWQRQYRLTAQDSFGGAIGSGWWGEGAAATTPVAVAAIVVSGVEYRFVEWRVDGVRLPGLNDAATNPAGGIAMAGPRAAMAVYVRASLDTDGNGLPDWWERRHFGRTGMPANGDFDADGAVNRQEYLDGTDPRERTDYPRAPVLAHAALAAVQATPSPWRIEAAITDNQSVSTATMEWRRNAGAWQSTPMVAESGNLYAASIPSPHALGDAYEYRLRAADAVGLTVQTPVYAFGVAYARMVVSPTNSAVIVSAGVATNVTVTVTNAGNAVLHWQCRPVWDETFDTSYGRPFTTGGANDLWHRSDYRARSGSTSWYCGRASSRLYTDSMNAWLRTPVVTPAPGARLRFDYWADVEYDDGRKDDHYWDGGVVEVSTNGGLSFVPLFPEGGYPHRITPNEDSPFAPDTPCFGGDGGWTNAVFDLSAYAGRDVQIQFRFGSDMYTVDEGWYIDNVTIESVRLRENWIAVDERSGSLAPGASDAVVFAVASTGVVDGVRTARVVFAANDPERGAIEVPATMTVDNDPPDARDAVVRFQVSPYGDYTLSADVAGSWYGFRDTVAGIAGYYVGLTDGGGTTGGRWVAGTNTVVEGLPLDERSRVYVWARDKAGNIGPAAAGEVLVLSADGDFDGDGRRNAEEEVSGTDAGDGGSVLSLATEWQGAGGETFVLSWPTALHRFYSLYRASGSIGNAPGEWAPVPDMTVRPGTGGTMSYTGSVGQARAVFYRIAVSD